MDTGRTELQVSPICYGTWQFGGDWGQVDERAAVAAIQHARAFPGVEIVQPPYHVMEIRNQSVRPHPSVVDPWAWGGLAVWIVLTTLGSVGLAVGLKALGVAYPGTVMGVTMTVTAVITTPILTRWMSMRTVRRAEMTN
ncbi:hypothetical protein OG884_20735 [Streptosporangium sp. NBC_01755]|uniref:hypothetical protein n=1 Tax=unclassified Streptosporangium TaxID=2632669 RepID=UPI002DDA94F0|nr:MULTISPECIES: hypothetical protein [unclassified Streptosporangium]WSA24601.1 hypothetical protein OIE13_27185 [Streptosporangium sp. NBC_01810]WSC97324.1 hypothetical protein OG884_20735 [Streptosporangium sp. NBC_01755]